MKETGCPYVAHIDGLETYFDPRYYKTGLYTNEWEIQTDSGVMLILEGIENS